MIVPITQVVMSKRRSVYTPLNLYKVALRPLMVGCLLHGYTADSRDGWKASRRKSGYRSLVNQLYGALPDFGEELAIDSKAILSFAVREPKNKTPDGRWDTDADFGAKSYRSEGKEGQIRRRISYWFGYKMHLIVDASYELPIAFAVTTASGSDITVAHGMLNQLECKYPQVLERCETLSGDKGYDDQRFIKKCGISTG